jgi:hypothetical protein
MPYFTKKGTGKDKGKTCVYKKEGKTKVGCTDGPIEKYMAALHVNESQDEWDWVRDTPLIINDINLIEVGMVGRYIGDEFGTGEFDGRVVLKEKEGGITSIVLEILSKITGFDSSWDCDRKVRGTNPNSLCMYVPINEYNYFVLSENKTITESQDEWDWVREIESDMLVPGEIYDIKTGNGYYWVPELFIGKKWDDEYNVEMYKFKDLDSSGSGGKSVPYIKELLQKGHIRPYDPNWSIRDEITFSEDIEDALKGNFVIYFKEGVYLDQTLGIQDKLFEMGFSFYTKEPNEYITNKDSNQKIQFFECFNWDTSNPRYTRMPSNQRNLKKILLVAFKEDIGRWRPKPNPRLDDQELFINVVDHNAIVINGDRYVDNNITESEDSDLKWIKDVEPPVKHKLDDLSVGDKFDAFDDIITITNLETKDKVMYDNGKMVTLPYFRIEFTHSDGELDATNSDIFLDLWDKNEVYKIIKESDEWDWIQQQEPEKEFKKSKSYVVDVSDLRPSPMKYSHDTTLTKQDILDKFDEIGYDVDDIDVDSAKYLYIEPTNGKSWRYDEDGTPIDVDYWIDYNVDYMEDPSYGGKYQIIDVDELMFLLDNNLLSENESGEWLGDVKKDFTTDPTKGIVSPSAEVIKDVCEKEKFCKAQGPITFGQLKHLLKNSKNKKLFYDVGEGGYKALIRLLPWFFPQVAIGGFIGSSIRAFNKILKPTIEETNNYKTWWGRVVLKVMKLAEGDLPINDPLSKIFFISDGLLHLMNDKTKLKFARYISELASNKPEDEPVPEFFVENELRKYLNDKFLLNPPLQPKNINESEDFGWLENMSEPINLCKVIGLHLVKPGDNIIIDEIDEWLEYSGDDHSELTTKYNINAEVLAVDRCDVIQPNNSSKEKVILVHMNEEYRGFDYWWVKDFDVKYQSRCMDGRCMFLLCSDLPNLKITKFNQDIQENKTQINEVAGISFEVREWANIVHDEILNNPEEKVRIIIDGYDHPDAFKGFPIDYIVIDFHDQMTGYITEYSGYDKDGNYVVVIYIQRDLVSGRSDYSLKTALNHELKHAWEDYNRVSKGLPNLDNTKESKEFYNKDFISLLSNYQVSGTIKEVLKYYYFLSKLEEGAYLENIYDNYRLHEQIVREIASKDFESLKDRFDVSVNWNLIVTNYDIPFLKKFKTPIDFIDYSGKELRSRALKMLKKINKMKYVHGKM